MPLKKKEKNLVEMRENMVYEDKRILFLSGNEGENSFGRIYELGILS